MPPRTKRPVKHSTQQFIRKCQFQTSYFNNKFSKKKRDLPRRRESETLLLLCLISFAAKRPTAILSASCSSLLYLVAPRSWPLQIPPEGFFVFSFPNTSCLQTKNHFEQRMQSKQWRRGNSETREKQGRFKKEGCIQHISCPVNLLLLF